MLIIMSAQAQPAEIENVIQQIGLKGYKALPVPGPSRTAICVTGNKDASDSGFFLGLPGVKDVLKVTKAYKLVSRETKSEDTVIDLGTVKIGGSHPAVLMAGPCSVETEERTLAIAEAVFKAGARIFRAGAYKPRTSPYDFQGMGMDGLKILSRIREKTGLKIVTEVVDTDSLDVVSEHTDIIQIGTRNMYNYSLLKKVGALSKPVLLKRGLSATLEEWLNAAEYIMMAGNTQIMLCERGIRTFSTHSRNTLDLNVIPVLRDLTHLPVIVDPSHGIGKRKFIRAMSRAALACGAHGLIVETHTDPASAFSDSDQTIDVKTFLEIVEDAKVLSKLG